MNMYLVKLILVGERTARDVYVMPRLVLHSEYHRVARVTYQTVYLSTVLIYLSDSLFIFVFNKIKSIIFINIAIKKDFKSG